MKVRKVVITGLGLTTSLGSGLETNWEKMRKGTNGVSKITRFNTKDSIVSFAATNTKFDQVTYQRDIIHQMMDEVIDEALEMSPGPFDKMYYSLNNGMFDWQYRLKMNEGTTDGDPFGKYFLETKYAIDLMKKYSISSSPLLISTACAASAKSIQMGYDAIVRNKAQRILVAASDCCVASEPMMLFSLLSALSTRNKTPETASRPFSHDRDGFVIGEGAGCIILEEEESAIARGAQIYGYITGCGSSTDNYHRTKGDPEAVKIKECMMQAIDASGLALEDISYINAHGTSTVENDRMETKAISDIFSQQLMKVTSIKSMIGHSLYASGVIGAVVSVKSLLNDQIMPTINFTGNEQLAEVEIVTATLADVPVENVLCNAFGFGGQNVSIIFSKAV